MEEEQVHLVHLVHLAHQELQAHQEREVQRATQAQRVSRVYQALKVLQDLKEQLAQLAHKVLLVLLVRGVNEESKALLDLLGNKGREVPLGSVVLLALQALLGQRVKREIAPMTSTSRPPRIPPS